MCAWHDIIGTVGTFNQQNCHHNQLMLIISRQHTLTGTMGSRTMPVQITPLRRRWGANNKDGVQITLLRRRWGANNKEGVQITLLRRRSSFAITSSFTSQFSSQLSFSSLKSINLLLWSAWRCIATQDICTKTKQQTF